MLVKRIIIDKANRMYQLPPEILSFTRSERPTRLLRKTDILDLARFNWPIKMETEAISGELDFAPASDAKLSQVREELANWFLNYHQVKLNPAKEIFLGGSISSILLTLSMAFVDHGDLVFVPDVGLPLYRKVTAACGGQPVPYSLSPRNSWAPDFEKINSRLGRVARLLYLNSPHNPSGSELSVKEMEHLTWIAGRENIAIINDAAWQTISGRKHLSLLSVTGGKKVGAEVYSFAYQFGMPDLRFGFAAGNREIINGLETASRVNHHLIPGFAADLALAAIRRFPNEGLTEVRKQFAQSAADASALLEILSLEKQSLDTTPFIWARISRRSRATTTAARIYRRARVLIAPGTDFGDNGEGYLRFSLSASPDIYRLAVGRLKKKLRMIRRDERR